VTNRIPDKTTFYKDGTAISAYSTSIIVANYAETYKTLDVEIYVRISIRNMNGMDLTFQIRLWIR
jgi:hypothetical protein